jgi:hypothetical protein
MLKPNQTLNNYCYELEVQKGKNIADAAMTTIETLDLLVWSSLVDVTKGSDGKYPLVYHFDAKSHVYNYIRGIPELEKKTSQLFMGFYMDNWTKGVSRGPYRQEDGTYALTWTAPMDETAPGADKPGQILEPYVNAQNDTGGFVTALEKLKPGKKLFGVSDLITGEEFMDIFSRELNVKGSFKKISYTEVLESITRKDFAPTVAQNRAWHSEFGWMGREADVLLPKDVSHLFLI